MASVAVEQVFSKGKLHLSHVRNQLSVQSTCALLCLRAWIKLSFVDSDDLNVAASLLDVMDDEMWTDDEYDIVG